MSKTQDKDYYKTLGIDKSANEEQIKDAYRKLAKMYHPDVAPDAGDTMKDINVAYDVLSNPDKRKAYDNPQGPPMNGFPFGFNPFGGGNPFQFSVNGMHFNMSGGNFHQQRILNCDASMTLKEMLLGNTAFEFDSPVGKLKISLPPMSSPGKTFTIRINGDANNETLLQVRMNLKIPNDLTDEQKKKIEELGI